MLPLFDAAQVRAATPWPALVEALREAFRAGCVLPPRHHHGFDVPGEREATLLLMPAWREGGTLGVKVVNIVPGIFVTVFPVVRIAFALLRLALGLLKPALLVLGGVKLAEEIQRRYGA